MILVIIFFSFLLFLGPIFQGREGYMFGTVSQVVSLSHSQKTKDWGDEGEGNSNESQLNMRFFLFWGFFFSDIYTVVFPMEIQSLAHQ